MAELEPKPQTDAEAAAEAEQAKLTKKKEYLDVDAYADKNSFFKFRIREDIVDYFKIDRTIEQNAGSPYKPKVGPNAKKPKKARPITSRTSGSANPLPAGKLIKVPTNAKKPPEKKAKGKPVKWFYIRIPYPMSHDALVLWINTQWKENVPSYFVTASGRKFHLNKEFKDKSKLRDIGKVK